MRTAKIHSERQSRRPRTPQHSSFVPLAVALAFAVNLSAWAQSSERKATAERNPVNQKSQRSQTNQSVTSEQQHASQQERMHQSQQGQNTQQGQAALGVFVADVEGHQGVQVISIDRNGPAEKAGMQPGDFILSIDHKNTDSIAKMVDLIGQMKPDETVSVTIKRAGQQQTLHASLASRSQLSTGDAASSGQPQAWLGVALQEPQQGPQQDQQKGKVVVARVFPSGPAARAGLYPGDEILEANGKKVTSPEQLVYIIESQKPNQTLHMTIVRDGQQQKINAELANRSDFFPSLAQRQAFYGGQPQNQQGQEGQEEMPGCAMQLEMERHAAVQRERIEKLVGELKTEVGSLRKEVRQLRNQTPKAQQGTSPASH